jgi:hypothetical protein
VPARLEADRGVRQLEAAVEAGDDMMISRGVIWSP